MVTFLGDVRFGEGFSFNGQYCGGQEKICFSRRQRALHRGYIERHA